MKKTLLNYFKSLQREKVFNFLTYVLFFFN